MRQSGIDIVSLTVGEPDFATPAHIKMAAIQAIDENFTHYTENQGTSGLIQAIVAKFAAENNLHFDPPQILVSCGAKHSIYNVMQAICNKGDEVVVAAPYWVSYPEIVKMADARPVIVGAAYEANFKITPLQLRRAINERTKAFIFNSPSNPTGAVYTQGEIEELAEVVKETGIYVIADEIYEKIVYDGAKHFSIGSIKEIRDQVITVNGVSKAFAMTGWRVGYLGAAQPVAEAAAKVQSQITSNATSISQRAAEIGLRGPSGDVQAMTAEFKRRRDFAVAELGHVHGVKLHAPKGAFYLFPQIDHFVGKRINGKIMKDDVDLANYFLDEEHLALVPGTPFGARNHLRLSYACSMNELQKGLERFVKGCRKLQEAF